MSTCTTPDRNAGPALLALLIGAKRAGDNWRAEIIRAQLLSIGIRINFSQNALATQPNRKRGAK